MKKIIVALLFLTFAQNSYAFHNCKRYKDAREKYLSMCPGPERMIGGFVLGFLAGGLIGAAIGSTLGNHWPSVNREMADREKQRYNLCMARNSRLKAELKLNYQLKKAKNLPTL